MQRDCLKPQDLDELTQYATISDLRTVLRKGAAPECPGMARTRGPLAERATCPWYYIKDIDHRRLPTVIRQAKCKCSDDLGVVTVDGPNLNMTCHEVKVKMPVLRLKEGQCAHDEQWLQLEHYQMSEEIVRVACAAMYNNMGKEQTYSSS